LNFTAVQSIPIVATAVPKSPAVSEGSPEAIPNPFAVRMATQMVRQGMAVDSIPTLIPAITFVPWPVREAWAMR